MPEFIDPVFAKTSPKRSFSVMQNERFGLVFAKTGSIISGIVSLVVTLRHEQRGGVRVAAVVGAAASEQHHPLPPSLLVSEC